MIELLGCDRFHGMGYGGRATRYIAKQFMDSSLVLETGNRIQLGVWFG